jgi:hypothetical protein
VSLTPEQRERALAHFRRFLRQRLVNLERLALDDLTFNVLLLRANATMLELHDAETLLRYRLAQRLERGSVTAFGTTLQSISKDIAGHATGVAGADIMLVRDRHYYIQVKSGPDTANRDIAQNIGALLNSARDPQAVCMFGVCYARPEQISGIVKGQLQAAGVGLMIGREFWEFISGDPNCLNEILALASEAAGEAPPGELSFAERVDRKLEGLTRDFTNRYGATRWMTGPGNGSLPITPDRSSSPRAHRGPAVTAAARRARMLDHGYI